MRARSAILTSLLIGAVTLAAGACATPQARPLGAALEAVEPSGAAAPYALALPPVAVDPAAALAPEDEAETWSPVAPDLEALQAAIEEAVARSGAFERLVRLDGPEPSAGGPSGAARPIQAASGDVREASGGQDARFSVPEGMPADQVLAAAFAERADLALMVRLRRHAIRYDGRNGWFIPNLINYVMFVFPAWFVADERYAAELELEAELRGVGSNEVVWRRTYAVDPTADLNHLQRGWKLFGSLTVPGSLKQQNYVAAGRRTLPHALNEVSVALASDLAALRRDMDTPGFQQQLRQTLAVCIGVSRQEAAMQQILSAADDASRVARLLADPEIGVAPARNVATLVEREPTRARILEMLAERASRTGPLDTLVVYFSGYGFALDGSAHLVPVDFDPQRPAETGIALRDLHSALAPARGRQVIILDTSFGGQARPDVSVRTLDRARFGAVASPAAGADDAVAESLALFAKGRSVVLAAAAGAAARERSPIDEDRQTSLLAARLTEAARLAAADPDRRGLIPLAEVFAEAQALTRDLSARTGFVQVPVLLGDKGEGTALVRTRAR